DKYQDELNKLGRSWFEQAREESERELAEVETWQREHNKWSAFNRRRKVEADFDELASVVSLSPIGRWIGKRRRAGHHVGDQPPRDRPKRQPPVPVAERKP